MTLPLTPIPVVLGVQIAYLGIDIGVYDRIILTNQSFYILDVYAGQSHVQLQPNTVDILALDNTDALRIEASITAQSSSTATVNVQAVAKNERVGEIYPQTIATVVSSASGGGIQTAVARAVLPVGVYEVGPIANTDLAAGIEVFFNCFNVGGGSGFYTYVVAAAFPEANASFPQGFFTLLSKVDPGFNGEWLDWTFAGSGDIGGGTTSGNGGWPRHPTAYIIITLAINTAPLEIEARYMWLP